MKMMSAASVLSLAAMGVLFYVATSNERVVVATTATTVQESTSSLEDHPIAIPVRIETFCGFFVKGQMSASEMDFTAEALERSYNQIHGGNGRGTGGNGHLAKIEWETDRDLLEEQYTKVYLSQKFMAIYTAEWVRCCLL